MNKGVKKRLLITCPDCYLESIADRLLGGQNYMLDILGCAFEMGDSPFLEQVEYVVSRYAIEEIVMLLDPACRFIKSSASGRGHYHTKAENVLRKRMGRLQIETDEVSPGQQISLAEVTFREQFDILLNRPALAVYLKRNRIRIRGFIVDRKENCLKEVHYDAY